MHLIKKTYHFNNISITLALPEEEKLRIDWQEKRLSHFPFWGKCWPAAEAMASFLVAYSHLIQGKKVLELAGGLGLPSLVAANFALEVCCSDYLPEPLAYVKASAIANNITNISTAIINWQQLPENIQTDVLLLSDVNYDPADFEALDKLLQYFLERKTLILLSTPQRIMGKAFIKKWIPYQQQQETIAPDISLFVLKS